MSLNMKKRKKEWRKKNEMKLFHSHLDKSNWLSEWKKKEKEREMWDLDMTQPENNSLIGL